LAKKLLNNSEVKPRGELYLHKTFASMDRVVHRKPGYAFGLSMYSNRIQNYEDMNNENRKGWYTGEGMTYLYNGDLGQFSDGYWPTVDPYRLPGTTIDTMTRADGSGEHRSTQSWTGGTTLDEQYGSAGMEYDAWNSSLKAKKSWFMFDNEIVALGAYITSSDDRPIETIVENRKIRLDGSNKVIINGESQLNELGSEKEIQDVEWAYLEGNEEGADIGYYFPEKADLHVKKELREGKWSDINYGGPEEVMKRSYATMWFDHGKNPNAATYAYTILPNRSADGIEQYAENPDIQILRNDKAVQAVHETTQNILGANFWESTKQRAGPLTVYDKASITMKETEDELEIAVSDPTMENDGTIEVEIDRKAFGVIEADEHVKVTKLKPFIKLEIDVKGAKGKTFTTKLQLNPKQSDQSNHFLTKAEMGQEQMEANSTIEAEMNISNQTTDSEKATVTIAFYNWKGELKEAVHHEEDFGPGQTKDIKQSLKLPEKIDGGEVRIFIWKGKDLRSGEYQLLSNVITFPVTY
jgi:hyaluronate lyase